jgi:hypothetical protein
MRLQAFEEGVKLVGHQAAVVAGPVIDN